MDEKNFAVKIICPDRIFYEGEAFMIEFSTTEGDIGVYKNHIPLTTVLRPGAVILTDEKGAKKEAAVHSGFAKVTGDEVTILAEIAEWPSEIDVERANSAKQRAEERLGGARENIDVDRASLALRRALVRLEVASNK
jgi:F-type H+-transporting ATPase subunit epsilon